MTTIDVVKDFIALGMIAEIDDYMIKTVTNIDWAREIRETHIYYSENQSIRKERYDFK